MAQHYLNTPLDGDVIRQLQVGDEVFLSGVIYMARDAAHKRFVDSLAAANRCLWISKDKLCSMAVQGQPSLVT
jgi:tartrate dehydratase beta subunit/fumarate hydratase class I family protein